MQPTVNSGTLIFVIAIWLAVSTSAVAGFALTAAQPNTRAVLLMGAGLVVVIGALYPVSSIFHLFHQVHDSPWARLFGATIYSSAMWFWPLQGEERSKPYERVGGYSEAKKYQAL